MRAITLFISIIIAGPVLAQDALLCVADRATGFTFDSKSGDWNVAGLSAEGLRYIVSPIEISSDRYRMGYRSVVQDINNDGSEIAACRAGSDVYGSLNCGEPRDPWHFSVRKETMRFVISFDGSYLTSNREIMIEGAEVTVQKVPDRGGKSPFIAIGRCSAI